MIILPRSELKSAKISKNLGSSIRSYGYNYLSHHTPFGYSGKPETVNSVKNRKLDGYHRFDFSVLPDSSIRFIPIIAYRSIPIRVSVLFFFPLHSTQKFFQCLRIFISIVISLFNSLHSAAIFHSKP